MKTILEFMHPDDAESAHHAIKADSYYATLFEIHEICVRRINNNGSPYDGEQMARMVLNEIKERLPEFLQI